MALTPEERKKALGFGGLAKVAKQTRRTLGHVSQVNARKRSDAVVERAIVRRIVKANPQINPDDVFGDAQTSAVAIAV